MAIERIVPNTTTWDAYYANHLCRYNFAKEHIKTNQSISILDAACGVGYGSKELSLIENSNVVGIDISEEAIKIATTYFPSINIQYLVDDCQSMGLLQSTDLFDYIISFETLEHLKNPIVFLKSCYEHLKINGKLIISTPNILFTQTVNASKWDFHEKEYEPIEFYNLLVNAGFKNVKIFGQQLSSIGSLREDMRSELNKVKSNPFFRLGSLIQKYLRGHNNTITLPEKLEDFDIIEYQNYQEVQTLTKNRPFVLIAICDNL